MDKPYFLQQLTLDNFMLHQKTSIGLAEHPIILITGANGSGKTQLLDALILCLGGHPNRLRKGQMSDLLGPFAKTAALELNLANPVIHGQRVLSAWHKNFAVLDNDLFTIAVHIQEDGQLQYYLQGNGKRQKILKKEWREILSQLSLDAENRLAFTEEGTVNVFSDQSGRHKLDLLLETTGLAAYRDNIASTLDSIDKASRALDPLRRKLSLEKEYLRTLQKARQLMQQKESLIVRHRQLVIEEAWSLVEVVAREVARIEETLAHKRYDHEHTRERWREQENRQHEINRILLRLEEDRQHVVSHVDDLQTRIRRDEGENNGHQRALQNLAKKKEQLIARYQQLSVLDVDREMARINKELKEIGAEKTRLADIRYKAGSHFFATELTHERMVLAQALEFQRQAAAVGLVLHGPLFTEIEVNGKDTATWEQLLRLLGYHMFSFVAATADDFARAVVLSQQLWPKESPPFFIISLAAGKSKKTAHATELPGVAAAPLVRRFLADVLKISLSPETGSLPIWQWVEESGRMCADASHICLPWPAVGNQLFPRILLPRPCLSLDELSAALHAEELYQQACEREKKLNERRSDLGGKEELHYVEKSLDECHKEMTELQAAISNNLDEINVLSKESDRNKASVEEFRQKIHTTQELLQETDKKRERLESEQESLSKAITHWEQNREEEAHKQEELTLKAQQLGPKPSEVHDTRTVAEERNRLQGQLDTLQISPVTEDELKAQSDKVARLEQEMQGSSEHIQHLQEDVQKRFGEWHGEVAKRIQAISGSMNELLSPVFHGVRLRVDDLKSPERAGLYLEVKRHSQRWLDLSHLSGGEKVLTVEALILSLHLQTESPVHAIDECTQRLDIKCKAQAFSMVHHAVTEIARLSQGPFAPQFILLAPDTLGVEFPAEEQQLFKQIVLAPAHVKKSEDKRIRVIEE